MNSIHASLLPLLLLSCAAGASHETAGAKPAAPAPVEVQAPPTAEPTPAVPEAAPAVHREAPAASQPEAPASAPAPTPAAPAPVEQTPPAPTPAAPAAAPSPAPSSGQGTASSSGSPTSTGAQGEAPATHTHADGTTHAGPTHDAPAQQGPPAAAPKPPPIQMPPIPAPPIEVVVGPPSKVDPLSLSGTNLGGPIQAFGKTISEHDIRRFLCFAVGGKQIDSHKFSILTAQELEKRKAAGQDVSKLVVTDAELQKALDKSRKDFLLKYPTLDFPTEVARAFLHVDIYKHELRRTLLFDKVFFPEDPNTWPDVTTQAIILASGGTAFVDDAKESYAQRKQVQIAQNLEDLPPDDPILVDTLRQWLLDSLNQYTVTEYHADKLPADVLITVEGAPVTVDEIWTLIQPHVTWENVADARRFLAQMAAVERDLEQRGALMSVEEFETNFMPGYGFKEAIASYEMVAVVLQGFPSMHADMRYERALRSYRKVIADRLTDEAMAPFLQRANMIAGAAKVDAEVILASAFDYPRFAWKADGWKSAEKKATELKQKLDAGADWGETLELHSEFWDPPMPEVGQKPQFGFNFKGRFGEQTRNQLVGDLHESDYLFFLRGTSVADSVFFDQECGKISGVMKGSRGYYIARLNSRRPGQSGLNLKVPQNREFMVNFVAMQHFGVHARKLLTEAIAKGEISGF